MKRSRELAIWLDWRAYDRPLAILQKIPDRAIYLYILQDALQDGNKQGMLLLRFTIYQFDDITISKLAQI